MLYLVLANRIWGVMWEREGVEKANTALEIWAIGQAS